MFIKFVRGLWLKTSTNISKTRYTSPSYLISSDLYFSHFRTYTRTLIPNLAHSQIYLTIMRRGATLSKNAPTSNIRITMRTITVAGAAKVAAFTPAFRTAGHLLSIFIGVVVAMSRDGNGVVHFEDDEG